MKILFLGFGQLSSELLHRLVSEPNYDVVGVVPRVVRSKTVPTDFEILPREARLLGVTVFETNSVNSEEFIALVEALQCDLLINWGHNQLFSRELLNSAQLGCANIHPGLLPCGRGSGAVIGEILSGRHTVGQTVHLMDEHFDLGEIVLQRSFHLRGDEYLDEIEALFAEGMVNFYFDGIEKIRLNEPRQKVVGFGAYYPKKPAGDEFVSWSLPSDELLKRIRLRSPLIPSITFLSEDWQEIHLWRVEYSDVDDYTSTPGQVIDRNHQRGILVKTGTNALWVSKISSPGGPHRIPSFPIGTCFVNNWIYEMYRLRQQWMETI